MSYLDGTGVAYLWDKIKAAFAAKSHTHAASDITSGTLDTARGGTGATTVDAARANLDAAQDGGASGTLLDAENAIEEILSDSYEVTASGEVSHAEGYQTTASGDYSHAQNLGTVASEDAQTAIGKYNEDAADAALIVGNGTSDSDRSNAFWVNWNGRVGMGRLLMLRSDEFTGLGSENFVGLYAQTKRRGAYAFRVFGSDTD